jgi:hypothetical protein
VTTFSKKRERSRREVYEKMGAVRDSSLIFITGRWGSSQKIFCLKVFR